MNMEDLTKLIKVLGYTASPNDNEALNACRMANATMASMNMTWEQLIRDKTIIVNEILPPKSNGIMKPADSNIEMMLQVCLARVQSASGHKFISSLNEWYQRNHNLTEKQKEALQRWYDNV